EKSKKHVLIATTQNEFGNLIEMLKPVFERLKKKKVKIKILTQTNNQITKISEKIKKYAEVKNTGTKARFCIADGKEIIFMVLDDNEVHPTYDVGIWVNTPLANDLIKINSK
ncbi:hypothetical protein HYY71_00610, partial [Candidatus Woesearchaeota archaeon]|nr:hypothetical protein [Candidatus Woesearchaeota archaeon]